MSSTPGDLEEEQVSLITHTHYSPLSAYGDLAPPSIGIIERMRSSIEHHVRGIEICRHNIIYSYTPQQGKDEIKYERNLEDLCEKSDINLYKREDKGLRKIMLDFVEEIDEKYIFFVEHDWEFIKRINLYELINTFENNKDINYVRFNARANREAGWDNILREDDSRSVPLCKVSSYSNHPHIVRTSKYKEWLKISKPSITKLLTAFIYRNLHKNEWLKIIKAIAEKKIFKRTHVRRYDDIEYILDTTMKKEIKKNGFINAHEKWGTFIYGSKGEGPSIRHLSSQDE